MNGEHDKCDYESNAEFECLICYLERTSLGFLNRRLPCRSSTLDITDYEQYIRVPQTNPPNPSCSSRTQVLPSSVLLTISATWNYDIPDPRLTSVGETQARSIPHKYPFLFKSPAPLLVSSPFRRTLQTSLIGFNRNPTPHPGFQENSSKPCDTGSPPSVLREEFPELDFELVVDGWDSKTGEWAPDETSLARRAAKMRKWLKNREEEEIVVVTHGGKEPSYENGLTKRFLIVPCSGDQGV